LLRDAGAAVQCQARITELVELIGQVLEQPAVKVMLYIGDCFEECPDTA
jgi:hypothetical protein